MLKIHKIGVKNFIVKNISVNKQFSLSLWYAGRRTSRIGQNSDDIPSHKR